MKFGFTSHFVLAGALAAVATPGFAQTQPQASDEAAEQGAGDIVVTAQRREQSLADVPVSVSVVSGERLAQNGLSNVTELSQRLPSLKIAQGGGVSIISVRGVASGNNGGFEQSVGTFVDGVYRGRSRAISAGLFDVERVEVLKGPQPTFFGNNVVAGALNITTKKPTFENAVNMSGLWSPSDGQYISEVGVTAALSDTIAVRLAGKLYGMNGYTFNTAVNRKDPRNRDAIGRFSVLFKPSDNFTSNFRFDIGRNRDRTPSFELLGCPLPAAYQAAFNAIPATAVPAPGITMCQRAQTKIAPAVVNSTIDGIGHTPGVASNYDFKEMAFTNELKLGNATLSSITSYFDQKSFNSVPVPINASAVPGMDTPVYVVVYENVKQFTQELRLTSDTGGTFDYMVGGYYARENLNSEFYGGLYFAPLGLLAGAPYDINTRVAQNGQAHQISNNYSIFGALTFRPADGLTLDLGGRYASVKKRMDRTAAYGSHTGNLLRREFFTPGPAAQQTALFRLAGGSPLPFADPERTDNKFTPSVKLSYDVNDDVMVYASWAKGFKAGGFTITITPNTFTPENANSYEAGIKANLLDRRLFLSAAYFRTNYSDLQEGAINIINGNAVAVVRNVGGSRSQGVEFSADAKLGAHVRFRADVTYLDSVYTDFKDAPCTVLGSLLARAPVNTGKCIGGLEDVTGRQRTFAAKWAGNVGMSFTYPVGENLNVRFDPQMYFTSSYIAGFQVGDELFRQPGYAKFDARLGIGPKDGQWEFAVIGKNLTNKLTTNFRSNVLPAHGTTAAAVEPHRSIAFQFSAKF